jgi:hypothetical protein
VIKGAAITIRGSEMAAKTWKAKIRLKNGGLQDITVQADNYFNAKAMIETQYGKGCIFSGPTEVR